MRFLRWVQETSLRFDGSAYRTMLRNDAYWFSRLGLYLERADNTARILDVKYHLLLPAIEQVGGPLDYFQWAAILRSVSALTAYHWVYRENVKPWLVADLLMLKDEMPRSLASCYENLVQNLDRIAARLWAPGRGAAPGPRRARPPAKQPHRRDLPDRAARIHRRLHRGQQPARHRDRAAISDVTPDAVAVRPRASTAALAFVYSHRNASPIDRLRHPIMRLRIAHSIVHRYDAAGSRRDPGAAAHAAQSRRPICGRLAHRRFGRLPARRSTKTLRQHHPRVHRRRTVRRAAASRSMARSRRRIPTAWCAARSSAFRRACSCAIPPLTHADDAHPRLRSRPARRRTAATRSPTARAARSPARRDRLRQTDPRTGSSDGGRSLRAQARRVPGPDAYLHRRRAQPAAFRPATSAATCCGDGGEPRRRPAMPGPKPTCPARLGRRSIRPTASARPTPMCASRSGSIPWRRAGARHPLRRRRRERWPSPSRSTSRSARRS